MVRSIEKGGPAEAAGLKELDVLWKIGDQMLVNEGQLAALLRLSKPGDEIVLSGFRARQADLEVKLKLGEAPEPTASRFPTTWWTARSCPARMRRPDAGHQRFRKARQLHHRRRHARRSDGTVTVYKVKI